MKKIYKTKTVKFKSKFGIEKRRIEFETLSSFINRGGVVKTHIPKISLAPKTLEVPNFNYLAA